MKNKPDFVGTKDFPRKHGGNTRTEKLYAHLPLCRESKFCKTDLGMRLTSVITLTPRYMKKQHSQMPQMCNRIRTALPKTCSDR